MSAYGAVLKLEDLACIAPEEAGVHIVSYQRLQEAHNRAAEARDLLERFSPTLVQYFDKADAALQAAKSQPAKVESAALDMRTLLDKLKGELFDKAREVSGEKMNWDEMAKRLGRTAEAQQTLSAQKTDRNELHGKLSSVASSCWISSLALELAEKLRIKSTTRIRFSGIIVVATRTKTTEEDPRCDRNM